MFVRMQQQEQIIIGNLNAGDKVKVLDRYYSDEWIQISFEGEIGYVYKEYLTFK